jgi:hypothetical protein
VFHFHTDPTLLTITRHASPLHFPSLTGQISHYSNTEDPSSMTRFHLNYIACFACWKVLILKWPIAALTDACDFQRLEVGRTLCYHISLLLKVHVRFSTHLHFSLYHRKVSLQTKNLSSHTKNCNSWIIQQTFYNYKHISPQINILPSQRTTTLFTIATWMQNIIYRASLNYVPHIQAWCSTFRGKQKWPLKYMVAITPVSDMVTGSMREEK